ncbi:MAG: ComF family protein [Flavobacteriaceae bacterium]|nr:ComF family protein [Flavobacteriaceae bacterium]
MLVHQEKILCVTCLHDLPLTNLHSNDSKAISNVFYGTVVLEHATALFYYPKQGVVRQLIHQLKYKNQEEISSYIGEWLGFELIESGYYNDIAVIVPVPLHSKRMRSRGYNQVEGFGKEIALSLNAVYNDTTLLRIKNTTTQTVKDRLTRWKNVETIFEVSELKKLEGQHILLVDDVITTGATIKACVKELHKIPNIKISLAVMAYTDQ